MTSLAQSSSSPELLTPWVPQLVSLGGFGLLLIALGYFIRAILTSKVITLARFNEMKQDRDDYKQLYKEERDLRVKAQESASVAIENSKVANHFLDALDQSATKIRRDQQ